MAYKVCSTIPDDGKVHEPRSLGDTKKTICGKPIGEIKTDGKKYTIQQSCTDCWPVFKNHK